MVTERELQPDENFFSGKTPKVGDELAITCRGRTFKARVVWGNWADDEKESERCGGAVKGRRDLTGSWSQAKSRVTGYIQTKEEHCFKPDAANPSTLNIGR